MFIVLRLRIIIIYNLMKINPYLIFKVPKKLKLLFYSTFLYQCPTTMS